MSDRKVKISWLDLEEILRKSELIMPDEEIKEITLMKPREILFYTKGKG